MENGSIFCNPCVHCWLPLLCFLDAISDREEWVTVLSCNEPSGGVPCQLAEKEFGGRGFSGDHDKHPTSNSGVSIVGSNTTWEVKMLKNRTDKESFGQMVHPQEQGTLITLLRIWERDRSASMAAEVLPGECVHLEILLPCSHWTLTSLRKSTWHWKLPEVSPLQSLFSFTCQEAMRELSVSELLGPPSAENWVCLSFWDHLQQRKRCAWAFGSTFHHQAIVTQRWVK